MPSAANLPPLDIFLCAPRGFCAGVDRAIQIVELALKKFGPPVYVRHEIVHNRYVVESLKAKGAIFVEELDEIPQGTDAPVIFSAHGVAKSVPLAAEKLNLLYLDATCPLVSKVHLSAQKHYDSNHEILLIGHAGHPEVIGTTGQLPDGAVTLIETVEEARNVRPANPHKLSYITQTTLSIDDTREIIDVLKARFPDIQGPGRADICYATTNRQEAVKQIAPRCDALIVVGAPNSSNSQRLSEVAERDGCETALLIQNADEIDWDSFPAIRSLGITAGASAPEILVEDLIEAFRARYNVRVELVTTAEETVEFKLPALLRNIAAE
ncbi:MAG: 4-hydroxy-3-methylbut-2-enyl diphosphate reductase [Fimbriimonadaceae bacterium]|nr:4-hydroxy-3-methylbut-2-enyl diphosphate reductase [Alphaproteobacteria bacterium]